MEKYHTDHVRVRFRLLPTMILDFLAIYCFFTKYLSIDVLPVASYYASNMKL